MVQYIGRIMNVSNNKWVESEHQGKVTYTHNKHEALCFFDEAEAISVVDLLDDNYSDLFVLYDNSDEVTDTDDEDNY